MNNLVTPFLNNHRQAYELHNDDAKDFEHFVNFLTIRNYTSRHFDPADISLGNGEVGIDGIAIIVNDVLITEFSQIEEHFKSENDISVSFVFTQSKTSENYDGKELSHFFAAVYDFINNGKINTNGRATEIKRIFQYIIHNPIKLSKNPDCHLFFAFTGKINEDTSRNALVQTQIDLLKKTSIFDEITFSLYDSNKIVSSCRAIKSNIKKTIDVIDCAVIPSINNVNEAYLGIIRCKEFIDLITNEDGAIMSNLFEDNVRYFQGHNTINAEIQATLRNTDKQEAFSILNNGVTIVANEMRRTGNSFTLTGFQIINGCQTSFVLYENRNRLSDNACMVIKVISTTDKDITDSIVKTTNRQTPVLNEAFETLRDFHKNLEITYESYEKDYRLYYERRSKQYDAEDINKTKIISFPFQTASYVAVFLEEPHSTHRYYGELLKSYSKKIYNNDDVLEQYCMASLYVYTVDSFLRHNQSLSSYKKYRFHIALILRYRASNDPLPLANSRDMKRYCGVLYEKIKDAKWVKDNIVQACNMIDDIVNSGKVVSKDGNDISRTREFTTIILDKIRLIKPKTEEKKLPYLKKGIAVRAVVTNWNSSFAYVELPDYKEIGSIHIRHIIRGYVDSIDSILSEGQEVEAYVLENEKHPNFGYALTLIK